MLRAVGAAGAVLAGIGSAALPARAASGLAPVGRPGPGLPSGLRPGSEGLVAAVLSGDVIDLADGERVRLAGVEAPRLGTTDRPAWPLAAEASAALGDLVLGRRVQLHHPQDDRDRWGRTIAHLSVQDPPGERPDPTRSVWIQGHLLMLGMARVRTFPRTATGARRMLDLERTARAADLGLWAERFYRVRNPGETWNDLDSVQIVEGRVVDAAVVRGTGYLNFGPDWRRDFTFRLKPAARRRFEAAGVDIRRLDRRRVRGRGWIFPLNGPMIDLSHPEQLEVLEE